MIYAGRITPRGCLHKPPDEAAGLSTQVRTSVAMLLSLPLIFGVLTGLPAVRSQSVIVPGAHWTDTSGNSLQAHGAGIIKVCKLCTYRYPFISSWIGST